MTDENLPPPQLTRAVTPFPKDRFLAWLRDLRIQTKDFGLQPFQMLGTQQYVLDEIVRGVDEGITTFVILKARQLGMCLDPSTLVLTADLKWVSINKITVGTRLVACDEENGGSRGRSRKLRTCIVEDRKTTVGEATEIQLHGGRKLIATPEHRFLCRRRGGTDAEWRTVSDLQLDDEIRSICDVWIENDLPRDHGYIGGLIDGEGSLRQKERAGCELCITQVAGDVLDWARTYLNSLGYSAREEVDNRKAGETTKFGNKPVHKLVVGRMDELFRLLGQTRPRRFIGREWWEGKDFPGRKVGADWQRVTGLTSLGERELIDLQTSTKTFLAEGLVSHNSTFFIALDLFWAMEYPGLCGAFATHTDQSKAQFRNIIKVFFRHLPKSHKIAVETENRDMVILKNGSMFLYLVAGVKEKTTSSMGRSSASNFQHKTEVAFWGSEDDKKELSATMSVHYAHRLDISESTANGFNHFYDQWDTAKDSPTQRAIFVGWWRHDHYAFPATHPWFAHYMPQGMDTPLHLLERKRAKEVLDRYGFVVSKEQIAWYRWKLIEDCDGDQKKMDELYPWVEEDAFVATGARFFTNESLTEAMKRARKVPCLPYMYALSTRWQDTQVIGLKSTSRATLRVYEEPDPLGEYVIGVDPAYGSSDDADRNAIHVARCYADRLVQVAEFCTQDCAAYQCAWVLAHLAGYYRNSFINLEINGAGRAVWDQLMSLRDDVSQARRQDDGTPADHDLRNVLSKIKYYLYRKPDHPGSLAHHWRTTHETKKVLMNKLRDSFELGRFVIHSMACLDEMKGVVQDGDFIGGEGRAKDDRAIAAGLAHIAWAEWVQPRLKAQGFTFEVAQRQMQVGPPSQVQRMAIDYLKTAKILMPGETVGGTPSDV